MSIDWSKAPEGATHFTPIRGLNTRPVYWRVVDGVALECWAMAADLSCVLNHFRYGPEGCMGYVASHAMARPLPWSGEGMPPVGVECEVVSPGYSNPRFDRFVGQRVKIVAHDEFNGDRVAVFRMPIDGQEWEQDYHALIAKCFRPLRTPEQIAAEEREKAVEEMQRVISENNEFLASDLEALYDAGYRKITE